MSCSPGLGVAMFAASAPPAVSAQRGLVVGLVDMLPHLGETRLKRGTNFLPLLDSEPRSEQRRIVGARHNLDRVCDREFVESRHCTWFLHSVTAFRTSVVSLGAGP